MENIFRDVGNPRVDAKSLLRLDIVQFLLRRFLFRQLLLYCGMAVPNPDLGASPRLFLGNWCVNRRRQVE